MNLGIFFFLFMQMILQAGRIRDFYDNKVAAELSFLQSQIKPHFIYNTLNSFIAISRYDMEQARRLMISFSSYLRCSFDFKNTGQLTSLQKEIELVKAYLEIEKVQFEERLEVKFDIEESEASVPVLVLQPIVENAIIHGVLPKREGGCIGIHIRHEGRQIKFLIQDDGIGMEREKLKGILKLSNEKGIGLFNINNRLLKLYGKGLQIKSRPGEGTEVAWSIPVNGKGDWP